ncbi:uncharacterized protein PFL1_01193 [Pseudozyma flocculosa PF-1]|uniref:uncharacterized protein n=1 Tax=Pseudozyma flocculosa PF-1 TaxID=1277687 RepID=UPI0004560548|nr:uncharacterized protein PFL1_01193 [Pseudozyma flocculosa PF-1]EPQ31004.1 hypothetical protein PFL1_01193 [Pseudozyma flocculosa PF-1]
MFKPLGLLASIPCPDLADGKCQTLRVNCPFSHSSPPPSTHSSIATATAAKTIKSTGTASPSPSSSLPKRPVLSLGTGTSTISPSVKKSLAPSTAVGTSSAPSQPPAKKARNAYVATSRASAAASTSTAVTATTRAPAKAPAPLPPRPATTFSKSATAISASKVATDGWSNVPIQPPTITFRQHPSSSQISLAQRQGSIKTLYSTFVAAYAPLLNSTHSIVRGAAQRLAHDHTLAQEMQLFKEATKTSYKSSCVSAILGVKKRNAEVLGNYARLAEQEAVEIEAAADDNSGAAVGSAERAVMELLLACPETGTALEVRKKQAQAEARAKGKLSKHRLAQAGFICPKGDLERHGFLASLPDEWREVGGSKPDSVGEYKECIRCGKKFCVGGEMNEVGTERLPQDQHECRYHYGKKRYERAEGQRGKVQVWRCCGRPVESSAFGDDSCCLGPHVFKEEAASDLNLREGFITTAELSASLADEGAATDHLDIVALDCELCFTTAGMSLTRLTLISEDGSVILDELVRSRAQVVDYNTRFSGIQPEQYERDAVLDLAGARRAMGRFVGESTILVGHGLENDLLAMRLVHTTVVDTALLFAHPRGLPFRLALRDLTSKYLGKIIQASGATVGHSSAEDAQMALELVRWKIVNDPFTPFGGGGGGGGGGGSGGDGTKKEGDALTDAASASASALAVKPKPKGVPVVGVSV